MTARFAGKCSECGERFAAGTDITWDKRTKSTAHLVCPTAAPAAAQAAQAVALAIETQPTWLPAAAGDSQTATGRRAVVFLLQHGQYASWQLDDLTVEMAAAACSVLAADARRDDVATVETLADLQGYLRSISRGRALAAALAAEATEATQGPAEAPIASPAPSQGPTTGQGGGGSKVPRKPRPGKGGPAAGLPVPAAVVAPGRLAPIAWADDAF